MDFKDKRLMMSKEEVINRAKELKSILKESGD